jgi:hypothetical protein
MSAVSKGSGSCFPRRLALRKIPAAAFGDSEYFCNSLPPPVSKTSDNEDSTAALWNSKVLSIKHPPADAIPALDQRFNDCGHISSVITGKKTNDIFENEVFRFGFVEESTDFPK